MLITVKGAGKVGDTVVLPALIRQSNVALQRIVSSLKLIIALGIARCDAEHLVVRFELLCHILVIGRFFRQDAGQGSTLLLPARKRTGQALGQFLQPHGPQCLGTGGPPGWPPSSGR